MPNKKELEKLWTFYKTREKYNSGGDEWFQVEFIQKPILNIENRLEPIIMREFFSSSVKCLKAEKKVRFNKNIFVYDLKKEGDRRLYHLFWIPEEEWFEGIYHDAGFEIPFWCGCGEVYDLYFHLVRQDVFKKLPKEFQNGIYL